MAGRLMSEKEKAAISMRAFALEDEGKMEEADALFKTIPLAPYLAKLVKEKWRAGDWLKESGWNLAEAEVAYGPDWLTK
jgi:hypothetical protein